MSARRFSIRVLNKTLQKDKKDQIKRDQRLKAGSDFRTNVRSVDDLPTISTMRRKRARTSRLHPSAKSKKKSRCKRACITCYNAHIKCKRDPGSEKCQKCIELNIPCEERFHRRVGRRRNHFFKKAVTKAYVQEETRKRKKRTREQKKKEQVPAEEQKAKLRVPVQITFTSNQPIQSSDVEIKEDQLTPPLPPQSKKNRKNDKDVPVSMFGGVFDDNCEDIFGFVKSVDSMGVEYDEYAHTWEIMPGLRELCMTRFGSDTDMDLLCAEQYI